MSGFGVPHQGIAMEATAKVAQSLFHTATVDKNVAAAIFWMKARAGWREKHEVQITATDDISQLSDEELLRVIARYDEEIRKYNGRPGSPALIEGEADDGSE